MVTPHEHGQIQALYLEAVESLVTHYSGETPLAVPDDVCASSGCLSNALGFGGFHLCGASTLSGSAAVVRHLSRGEDDVEDPEDWLAELNNQVLGRLKNMLCRFGIAVTVSTPMRAAGGLMAVGAKQPAPTDWRVRWSCGELFVSLSIAVASHLTFAREASADVLEEGSLQLF